MKWKIIHVNDTDSTNRYLRELDVDGDVCVWTDYQTAGRGCGTNTWESERGKNLLFSLLIHPANIPVNKQFVVSMAVANSIAKVVSKYVKTVSVKWPNDIYVRDKKLCGILIENRLRGGVIKDSIIGVGLNVNQLCFVSDAPNPISLANLTGCLFDREELLQELLEAFEAELADLEGVRTRYLSQLYWRKGFHRYRNAWGECYAEIMTVEDDGHLLLSDVDGHTNRYAFKEVEFVIGE
ncbi:MAG: biotin--[Prevotella sp.]|nr:biotin--[acetyl-CoA-carboxylase] ligase [Prevotella sp.]